MSNQTYRLESRDGKSKVKMKDENLMKRITVVLIGLMSVFLLVGSAWADTIVPSSLATIEGNSNNGYPFNIPPGIIGGQRYQQVYDSNQFSAVGTAFFIDEILFRPDATYGSAFSGIIPNIDILLSTTSKAVNGLSATFSDNIGADETLIHSGALSLSSAFTGSGPKDFDIGITLSTPFWYDSSLGNLLLDIKNYGGGSTTQFDAHRGGLTMGRVNSSTGVGNTVGSLTLDYGLITMFSTTSAPVPEPATMLLFGLGILGLAGISRKK